MLCIDCFDPMIKSWHLTYIMSQAFSSVTSGFPKNIAQEIGGSSKYPLNVNVAGETKLIFAR